MAWRSSTAPGRATSDKLLPAGSPHRARLALLSTLILTIHLAFAGATYGQDEGATRPIGEPQAPDDPTPVVTRVNAYFASLPDYAAPCEDLEPHYLPGLVRYLQDPAMVSAGLPAGAAPPPTAETLVAFRDQGEVVKNLRKATARAAADMMLATLAYFRLVDAGEDAFAIHEASSVVSRGVIDWYVALWQLHGAEEELRRTAEAYYSAYARGFAYGAGADRARVLEWFSERTECLHKARRESFQAIEANRRSLLQVITSVDEWDRTSVDNANSILRHATLQWAYGWLVSEAAVNSSIHRRLLEEEERRLLNTALHPLLQRAYVEDPGLGPEDPIPPIGESRALRLEISRLRAQQAVLTLYEQESLLEAGFARKASIASGLWEAGAKALDDLRRAGALVERNGVLVIDPAVHSAALLGIAYKFFSSTLDAVVTPTVKDPMILAFRDVTGFDIQTAMEKSFAEYETARREVERRAAVFRHMATQQGYDEGLALARTLATGQPAGVDNVAARAPTTVRSLLEDAHFVAASRGGLAHVLEVLCEDPADVAGLWLGAAQRELTGSARSAYHRVAAERAANVENPDLPLNQRALLELMGEATPESPGSASEFIVANTDRIIDGLPYVSAIRYALTELLDDIRYGLEYLKGNVLAQDAYLRRLVSAQEWAGQATAGLARTGYRLDSLRVTLPTVYELHVSLLGSSTEWTAAYRRIREGYWERVRLYLYADAARGAGRRMTADGQTLLAAAQTGAELELGALASHAAWLRFEHHVLTANPGAAAVQLAAFQQIENARREVSGARGRVDLSGFVARLEADALRGELIATYQELYYKALQEAAIGIVSTQLTNSLLTRLIGRTAAPETVDLLSKLGETFNPWIPKFSASGVWSTLKGGLGDAVKAGVAQSAFRNQESLFGASLMTQQEIDKVVEIAWDVSTTVAENVGAETTAHLAESSVAWYADSERYDRLLSQAEAARATLDARYEASRQRLAEAVAEQEGGEGGVQLTRDEIERQIAEESSSEGVLLARLRYQLAMAELEEVAERREGIQSRLQDVIVWIPIGAEARRRALAAAHTAAGGRAGNAAVVHAMHEAGTRLALGVHTMDDLRLLAEPATADRIGFAARVLTPQMDIDLVRAALRSSQKRAKTTEEREEVQSIAVAIDDRRIATIDRLLGEFMSLPGNASSIVAIIQGGAAKGNPEYQGIHADIDFTVFVDPAANVDQAGLKRSLLTHFREAGYPLAESAELPSSMDSEAFVQPWGRFDATVEKRVTILEDVQEKRADPTRFYSEAGTKWFLNNVHYSGKVLWQRGDTRTRWETVRPGEAHGLAIDMARYLGFLTDPHYDLATIRGLDPAERRAALESVLKKTKYYIRLIDAYEIAHSEGEVTGNALYNQRSEGTEQADRAGRDASYHWQIYSDLEQLMAAQREGRTQTVFEEGDLEIVRWMAAMKMKGENPSPWDALRRDGLEGDDAIAAAERMLSRMQELAPRIFANTASVWEGQHDEALASTDDARRRAALNDIARLTSTMRNVLELDDYGASALMVPPDPDVDPSSRLARHEAAIRASMDETLERRRAIEAHTDGIVASQPPEDLLGEETKKRVQEALEESGARLTALEIDESRMLPWFRYLFALTAPLAE